MDGTQTLTEAQPLAPFRFNALLKIVDEDGLDTGSRCRYVGLTGDKDGRLTGEAHVTLLDRKLSRVQGNINIAIHLLRPA